MPGWFAGVLSTAILLILGMIGTAALLIQQKNRSKRILQDALLSREQSREIMRRQLCDDNGYLSEEENRDDSSRTDNYDVIIDRAISHEPLKMEDDISPTLEYEPMYTQSENTSTVRSLSSKSSGPDFIATPSLFLKG